MHQQSASVRVALGVRAVLVMSLWLSGAAVSRGVVSFWERNAFGQPVNCDNDPVPELSWPSNNLWVQQETVAQPPGCLWPVVTQPSNWSTPQFPDNGNGGQTYDVVVDAPSPAIVSGASAVIDVNTLNVFPEGEIEIRQGATISIVAGSLYNEGLVDLAELGASGTRLQFTTSATIFGAGEIVLSDNANHRVSLLGGIPGGTLTHESAHTIRGAGTIAANGGTFLHRGTIRAEGIVPLTLDPGPVGIFQNDGVLQAAGPGGITLAVGTFRNNTSLDVLSGSKLTVGFGAVVQGGLLTTTGTGQIIAASGATFQSPIVQGVVHQSGVATVGGNFVNHGTWNLASDATPRRLVFAGPISTLSGVGSIVLSNHAANEIATDGGLLVNSEGHTIRGAGKLLTSAGGLSNFGTIIAQGSAGLNVAPGTGQFFWNLGTVRVDPGSSLVLQGSAARYEQFAGQTHVRGTMSAPLGILVDSGELIVEGTVATTAGVTLHGLLTGPGTVQGPVVNGDSGVVAPGAVRVPGQLTINGPYTQQPLSGGLAGSVLEIDLGGRTPATQYDRLVLTGAGSVATLGGELAVQLVNGFWPNVGDSFTILSYGSRVGQFNLVSPPPGIGLAVNYQPTSLTLTVTSNTLDLVGDLDRDGDVDRIDAATLTDHLGLVSGATAAQGDLNADGRINLVDLHLLQRHIGDRRGASPPGAPSPIPEPATALLALLLLPLVRAGMVKHSAT